jgi:hypothetical protein
VLSRDPADFLMEGPEVVYSPGKCNICFRGQNGFVICRFLARVLG